MWMANRRRAFRILRRTRAGGVKLVGPTGSVFLTSIESLEASGYREVKGRPAYAVAGHYRPVKGR